MNFLRVLFRYKFEPVKKACSVMCSKLDGNITRRNSNKYLESSLCVLIYLCSSPGLAQSSNKVGVVNFYVDAKADFDIWTKQPSEITKGFMREKYYRKTAYSPYFDSRLAWYPNAWDYQNAYGIHINSTIWNEHPDWVLKDREGNFLFIPFACDGQTCPRYAADIGNPEFRADWIARQEITMEAGYIGIWVDDVNLASIKVGNGAGSAVVPIDPRTGEEMVLEDWTRYFADFMEEIKAAFPTSEIVHNIHWWANTNDDSVRRQLYAADYINLERGISDKGITGGTGKFGFEALLSFVENLHENNIHIVLDDDDDTGIQERDYDLAFYFLINNGGDLIGADGDRSRMSPDNYWAGYNTNLGVATSDAYRWQGLFRRDFQCGIVLVNQPDMDTVTANLSVEYTSLDGRKTTSETLPAASGSVLSKACESLSRVSAVDDTAETSMNKAVMIDVLANDSGAEDDNLGIEVSSAPTLGLVTVDAEMNLIYEPFAGSVGIDTFEYKLIEDGAHLSYATVTVTVRNSLEPATEEESSLSKPLKPSVEIFEIKKHLIDY